MWAVSVDGNVCIERMCTHLCECVFALSRLTCESYLHSHTLDPPTSRSLYTGTMCTPTQSRSLKLYLDDPRERINAHVWLLKIFSVIALELLTMTLSLLMYFYIFFLALTFFSSTFGVHAVFSIHIHIYVALPYARYCPGHLEYKVNKTDTNSCPCRTYFPTDGVRE